MNFDGRARLAGLPNVRGGLRRVAASLVVVHRVEHTKPVYAQTVRVKPNPAFVNRVKG